MKIRLPSLRRSYDWWLYILPILLVGLGIAMITSLTYGTAQVSLAIGQGIAAGVGLVAMVVCTRIDYRNWRGLATWFYLGVVVLLIAVDRFGVTVFGARRWLAFGSFQLQPSELAKLVLVLLLAKMFTEREQFSLKNYLQLAVVILVPILLVLLQPDLGTAIILSIVALSLLIAGGLSRRILLGLMLVGLLVLPIGWHKLAPYQKSRVVNFLHPAADPYGSGYNVLQALIAVGDGGLKGQGLGQGSQSQHQFLPVAHTDFIFAGVAEATGFIGSVTLILLLMFLVMRVVRVAQYSKDQFGFLVGVGIATLFLSQAGINIAMNLAYAPVTGIPLPFVSHGGTALLVNFTAIGILQSIYLRHKKIAF